MLKKQMSVILLLITLFTGCANADNTVSGTGDTDSSDISVEENSAEHETTEISQTYETESETEEINSTESEEAAETFQETETSGNDDDSSPNFLICISKQIRALQLSSFRIH